MRTWARIASLVKPKNLQGELVTRSVAGFPFLLREGMEVAFVPPVLDAPRRGLVTRVDYLGENSYLVAFDTVTSIDQAEALSGSSCLVRRSDLPSDFECFDGGEPLGFAVYDREAGRLGTVAEVIDNPAQRLLVVAREQSVYDDDGLADKARMFDVTASKTHSDKAQSYLIPWVPEIVIEIDEEARSVFIDAPKGLLSLAETDEGAGEAAGEDFSGEGADKGDAGEDFVDERTDKGDTDED